MDSSIEIAMAIIGAIVVIALWYPVSVYLIMDELKDMIKEIIQEYFYQKRMYEGEKK